LYEAFYGLREKPFSLTPNPGYVFYTESYLAALEQIRFGLEQKEGFLLLTGLVGTGKTTLCRELLGVLDPRKYRTALLFNPFLNAHEMLQALLSEFGCNYPPGASRKELLDRLNRYLLAQLVEGRICVAIFDEAQHLSPELLEQIRVLSNLETASDKLLQILLVGQPELRERIQQSLAQLDQRVSIRCTLQPLSRQETERYIYHRLNVAGAQGRIQFSARALRRIHQASGGIPRLINLICDRTLLAGYVAQTMRLGRRHVEQAVAALRGDLPDGRRARRSPARRVGAVAIGVFLLAAAAAAGWYAWHVGVIR